MRILLCATIYMPERYRERAGEADGDSGHCHSNTVHLETLQVFHHYTETSEAIFQSLSRTGLACVSFRRIEALLK